MAKSKDDKADGVSKAVVGGTTAADLPASVGGTRDPSPAPATTDAAGSPPPDPFADLPDPADRIPGTGPGPGRDTAVSGGFGAFPNSRDPSGFTRAPAMVGEGEADVSVRDFVGSVKEFTAAMRAGQWGAAVRTGGAIVAVFSDLMDGGGLTMFGTTAADATALESVPDVERQLAECRAGVGNVFATGRAIHWHGGAPHPLSGSPAPLAAVAPGGPKTFDPTTLIVLVELVAKLWQAFRDRNKA